jgi:hypothetical protein
LGQGGVVVVEWGGYRQAAAAARGSGPHGARGLRRRHPRRAAGAARTAERGRPVYRHGMGQIDRVRGAATVTHERARTCHPDKRKECAEGVVGRGRRRCCVGLSHAGGLSGIAGMATGRLRRAAQNGPPMAGAGLRLSRGKNARGCGGFTGPSTALQCRGGAGGGRPRCRGPRRRTCARRRGSS